jgi:hypothetical protein
MGGLTAPLGFNPWAGDFRQHQWEDKRYPRDWRDRILDAFPDADYYNTSPLAPSVPPSDLPGRVIDAEELMRRQGRAQHGIENPYYPYSVQGFGGVRPAPVPLSPSTQELARQRGMQSPRIDMNPGPGPYPYDDSAYARRLLREQQFVDQLMERGSPNWRALPPWSTDVNR